MIKLQLYLLLLEIFQLCIPGMTSVSLSLSHWYPGSGVVLDCIDSWSLQPYLLSYNLGYRSESILLAVVLWNCTKIKPQQHISVFFSVTSPLIWGPRVHWCVNQSKLSCPCWMFTLLWFSFALNISGNTCLANLKFRFLWAFKGQFELNISLHL